jgi:hypothetical protein
MRFNVYRYSQSKVEKHDKLMTENDIRRIWFCFTSVKNENNLEIFEEHEYKCLLQN